MRNKTDISEIVRKLEGMSTIETAARVLNVSTRTAINIISKLRKGGYVEYYSAGRKKRIYRIGILKSKFKGNPGLYETVNKYSKIKLQEPYHHFIHGRKLSIEEALVLAVNSGNFRLVLASLNLFSHVKNWRLLNNLAKKYTLQRNIGALYEVTKKIIKVRRMDERTRKSLFQGNGRKYIIEGLKSNDFKDLERKWRVKIPLNFNDLARLKTG
ncbi:hypothetical protein HYV50_05390 [Candidatus Pacearchaeota archaeon]|nr:hypothetical protein [Candidatus Pacearchaeota archaeon]